MKKILETFKQKNGLIENESIPLFFRIGNISDKQQLSELLNSNSHITVFDELIGQLEELVKSQNPRIKYTKEALNDAAKKYIGEIPMEEYGVWVYYPWANRLVHLLDEQEFIYVRTNRNQYKITPDEEEFLAAKKIGIIGLSVGKSIALTIAMERICGEIRIADFDIVELSNLNRIQTGVQNLGILKTIAVAREIAEIDPFLKVVCFNEGITELNIDSFITNNGKLDLVIDECDGLSVKILCRQKAQEYGIPVIMGTSDRGMLDVERFDLEPKRPIFHGYIEHLDINDIKKAKTNEEKVPYILPILGIETLSTRMKASMLEIEQSISTWPQLASSVVLGGGICTDVCRRIFLNQFHDSGRYFMDVEAFISNQTLNYIEKSKSIKKTVTIVPKSTIEKYQDTLKKIDDKKLLNSNSSAISLNNSQIEELLNSAISAPSAGNMQPWSWLYKDKSLLLFYDKHRSKTFFDYKDSAAHVALGAATENLILKARVMNIEVSLNSFPLGMESDIIGIFNFSNPSVTKKNNLIGQYDNLVDYIPYRLTNRNIDNRIALKKEDETYLIDLVKSHKGYDLKLMTSIQSLNEIKEIISEADRLFLTSKTGNAHFTNEVRWDREETELTKDGLDIETIDITPSEKAGLMVSKDWEVTEHIKNWKLGNAFGKLSRKMIDASSALGLIVIDKNEFRSFFDSGRVIEQLWLGATFKNIAFQPLFILNLLFSKINDEHYEGIEEIKDELILLNNRFKHCFNINNTEKEIFFFKLSITQEPKIRSLRRPIEDILMREL